MAGRLSVACVSLLAVLAFLLLFASGSHVNAVTYKMGYSSVLSCAGPNGVYNGGTGDDSCVQGAFGPYSAGLNADVISYFDVWNATPKHSMYSLLATMGMPSTWQISTDKEIPDGASIGKVVALSTLALFGGACTTPMEVVFPMYDCSTDITDTIAWNGAISGKNLTYGHKDGLPAGCLKYPQHVLDIVGNVKPRARYYGFVTVLAGMPPTQLNFMMFNPGELTSLALPKADFSDELGFINFTVLDNPNIPADPTSALDELCTPLGTTTTLYGLTAGEGALTQDVFTPAQVPAAAGSFWKVGRQDGATFYPETCGNGIDDDGDTRVDEMCGHVRVTNPAAGKGILGTGSHLAGGYSESYRDPDGDTIANNEDECPFTVNTGTDTDGDFIDNACDPTNVTCTLCDQDGDLWRNQADNCPLVLQTSQANDKDDDSIGDECDPAYDDDADGLVNEGCTAVGSPETGAACDGAETVGAQCADALDNDKDGLVNDGCVAVGVPERGDQCRNNVDDGEDWKTAPDGVVNDGCPAAALDNDGDTVVNDGCTGATAETGARCQDGPNHADGHYLNDMVFGSLCIGAADADGDGWCDATENKTGYLGVGNPISKWNDANSVPEWRVLDPLVRAQANPPGQAPGTCSNRAWYDTHRLLGGAETDDDADATYTPNLFDANACPGMNLDLTSAPSSSDPLKLNASAVINSTWHELWPTYSNNYTATSHDDADGDTTLSQGDQIDLNDGHDYHVDEVTITIWVEKKPIPSGTYMYLEFYASATDFGPSADGIDNMQDAIDNPQSTQWEEIAPNLGNEYDLLAWYDTGADGLLNVSDQIVLKNELTGATAEYHVADVTIDIIVVQKPDGDTDQDGIPNASDNCPTVWNPTQRNTDYNGGKEGTIVGVSILGDACDTDDDNDKTIDTAEWALGSDPKNVCDPISFDLNQGTGEKGIINVMDVLMFSNKLFGMPCNPPADYLICEATYRSK